MTASLARPIFAAVAVLAAFEFYHYGDVHEIVTRARKQQTFRYKCYNHC